jgi:hypothetical protein
MRQHPIRYTARGQVILETIEAKDYRVGLTRFAVILRKCSWKTSLLPVRGSR